MSRPSMSSRSPRGALAALGAMALTLTTAAAAQADRPQISHFRGSGSHIEQEEGTCMDLPFPLLHEVEFNAVLTDQVRNGTYYFRLVAVNRSVYTNMETGASLTGQSSVQERDQRIVDNGDGTLTITFKTSGRESYHTPAGALIGIRLVRQTVEIVLDHAGTPADPSDDEVLSETWSEPTGVDTLGLDECSVAAEYLG